MALQFPALQANNLPALKAILRSTALDAPRSVHRPPTLSVNLGTAAPLPLAHVVGSTCTVTGTIDQLQMEIDPTSHTVTETSRKRGGGSRGGKSGADKKEIGAKIEHQRRYKKKDRKTEIGKKPKRGGGASG